MNLIPPLPGDDQRAEDILDALQEIFTHANARMRWDAAIKRFTIDDHKQRRGVMGGGPLGFWSKAAEFNATSGRWENAEGMAEWIVRRMLDVIAKHKAHLVLSVGSADPEWILCIANEFGEYRGIAELSQITPRRYDWRPMLKTVVQ